MTKYICEDCYKEVLEDNNWSYWVRCKCGGRATMEEVPVLLQTTGSTTDSRLGGDRLKYAKDILQPMRDGELSKEFVEQYPAQAKKRFKPEQIAKAKYVWDEPVYKQMRKESK